MPCTRLWLLTAALTLAVAGAVAAADEQPAGITIRLVAATDSEPQRFEARGLTAAQLRELQTGQSEAATSPLAVFVESGDPSVPAAAMFGTWDVTDSVLRFTPRFPLQPGLTYRGEVRLPGHDTAVAAQKFAIPAGPPPPVTQVAGVYPTAETLPENLLKFYLHFTAPMSRGDSYRYVRLLRADGEAVELPFLELGEELWNESATRLTLFFDPGRVKRGLLPRDEEGPALEEGKSYTLAIDSAWPDAAGRPLGKGFRRTFKVTAPDETQPDPEKWTISAGRAGTTEPLVIEFEEPLDHAMLHRVLTVQRDSESVAGTIGVDRGETRWTFAPAQPWQPGEYRILVETTLEDRAGNSIGRPFEVDVFRPIEASVPRRQIELPFRIAPAAGR